MQIWVLNRGFDLVGELYFTKDSWNQFLVLQTALSSKGEEEEKENYSQGFASLDRSF